MMILASCESNQSSARLYALHCEGQENPLGIDRQQPQLQWKIRDGRRGAAQTAYQVLVASSPALLSADQGDLWDSGLRSRPNRSTSPMKAPPGQRTNLFLEGKDQGPCG